MTFEESLKFRHACKIFDENKKISEVEFAKIAEAARLSPSSFGLEHWDLWLVQNAKMREALQKACWNQAQIPTCSHLVVVFAKIAEFRGISEYIKAMVARKFGKSEEQQNAYLARLGGFMTSNVGSSDIEIFAWSKAQCFLAAQNMMSMAATIGIDSCPIEGFDEGELNNALGIDAKDRRVAMLLAFGYRVREQSPQTRRSMDEVLKVFS